MVGPTHIQGVNRQNAVYTCASSGDFSILRDYCDLNINHPCFVYSELKMQVFLKLKPDFTINFMYYILYITHV